MRSTLLVLAGIAAFLLAINTHAVAQVTAATLSGMVTNETAAVLSGVQVTVVNRANFRIPRAPQAQVLNPTTGTYVAGTGKITNTVTNSRELQFGLKLAF